MNKENKVLELDAADIERGGADPFTQRLFSVWRQSQGYLASELVDLSPYLLMFDGQQTGKPAPDMLIVGENALATRILGADWSDRPRNAVSDLDDGYIELIGRGYKKAIYTKKPVFEYVATSLKYGDGPAVELKYQRLIVPFQTIYGCSFLFCYSHDVGTNRPLRDLLPDDKPLQMQDPQNMGHAIPILPASSSK